MSEAQIAAILRPAPPKPYFRALAPVHAVQLDFLKLIAVLAMIVDHWNTALNQSQSGLAFLIGRLAFPVFAVMFAFNLGNDPARWRKMARRLWIAAVLCQPFYTAAFRHAEFIPWYGGNVLFSFAALTQGMIWWTTKRPGRQVAAVALVLAAAALLYKTNYGLTGIVFLLVTHACFHAEDLGQARRAGIAWWILLMALNQPHPLIAVATGVLPWFIIEMSQFLRRPEWSACRFMPGHAFYWIYGGHLALFALLGFWFGPN